MADCPKCEEPIYNCCCNPVDEISQDEQIQSLEHKVKVLSEALESIELFVNKQAEDEGLWFVAETAPEAYLQNGLRELHGLIEHKINALNQCKEE